MPVPRGILPSLVVIVALLLSACGAPIPDGTPGPPVVLAAPVALAAGTSGVSEIGGRPVEVHVPPAYGPADPVPLLVVLHGLGSDPARVDALLGLRHEASERGVLYVLPEGTRGSDGRRFWNATDACCDRDATGVDDSAYLATVVRELAVTYAVDPGRVAVVGYSNGGFMAHRTACDHADLVSVAVSLAGATAADDDACRPSAPVSVVQVHGTEDPVIAVGGGRRDGRAYPSAEETALAWARLDDCADGPAVTTAGRDLDMSVPGPETTVAAWSGCADGARVELWTIAGGDHAPELGPAFAPAVLDLVTGVD
ncbi:PHB depolymerase family esterase [Isoptericola hypogeus]|uniref:PHB depolymerase family esterase n=1 Tax=Isoptericola hypogeus TaxID=300179 RepID=A0ABP4V6B0_9MICO